GQSCSVTGGTGTTPGANVSNVGVSCVANTYTVGGTMSGLSGSVVLRNNGGSDLTVSANGGFTFPTALQNGSAYSVSVLTQPARQTCVVSNGAGTVSGTSVATVAVNCTTNTFSVGGTVSGIAGTVVLQNNGTDSISISGNGVFAFPTAVADGGAYSVAVLTQPANQTCTVVNGAGTASGADVSNVGVNCVANTFALSGTVSGLSGSVVLQNNGGNNLTVLANGGFTFLTALQNGSAYNVTVLTQPSGQTCTVANGTGTVSGNDVVNVAVNCATNTFSVGGTVSGLVGAVVLRINGINNLTVSANGTFTFSPPLADGTAYTVTVFTQPTGQSCSVTG